MYLEDMNQNRIIEEKNKNILPIVAKLLIFISAITIIISFFYLITRRFILVADSTIRAFGVNGFLTDRAIYEIFVGFTKFFDSTQTIACFTLLIGFSLILKKFSNIKVLTFIISFTFLTICNIVRPIIIHGGPDDYFPTGENYNAKNYYDWSFFILSTDTLRILIILLLIIAIYFLYSFLKKIYLTKVKLAIISIIILSIFLIIYIITIRVGMLKILEPNNIIFKIVIYYLQYSIQTILHVGNIIAFLSLIRMGRVILTLKLAS